MKDLLQYKADDDDTIDDASFDRNEVQTACSPWPVEVHSPSHRCGLEIHCAALLGLKQL